MFHRKPLYVAIAQRKEERQVQLQLQYAQRMAGFAGPSTTVIPGGYPPIYYQAPSGVVPPVPARPGIMYQPLGLRPGWRTNGFAPTSGPVYQPPPVSVVSPTLSQLSTQQSLNFFPVFKLICMHVFPSILFRQPCSTDYTYEKKQRIILDILCLVQILFTDAQYFKAA